MAIGQSLAAQHAGSILHDTDSIVPSHQTKLYIAAAGTAASYALTIAALSNTWYNHYPRSSFHFFNDTKDWLQLDKMGHVFSSYTVSRLGGELWRWAGLTGDKRVWVAGLSGAFYMTTIEVMDGFSTEWGFSMGDIAANLAGSFLYISQELGWREQRLQIKFSSHHNNYGDQLLNQRAGELFGYRSMERTLKDYNAQTYWLSANLYAFTKAGSLPRWLNLAVGYGANGMFGGSQNMFKDKTGAVVFDRRDIYRYRQWWLAPDIDLTRIKTKSKFLKTAFFLLSSFKFPTPAIGFSKKGMEWKWMQF